MYEETSKVSEKTLDIKRAIDSLREEVQAVDLYNQRADATQDEELKKVLLHNAKEEKEHSAMLIEWLRKNDSELEAELKEYLFKS
jgi:hypothetical protein